MITQKINTTIFRLQLKKDVCSNFNINPKLNDNPKNLKRPHSNEINKESLYLFFH